MTGPAGRGRGLLRTAGRRLGVFLEALGRCQPFWFVPAEAPSKHPSPDGDTCDTVPLTDAPLADAPLTDAPLTREQLALLARLDAEFKA
ncbi:hypothetical protein [Streptosporangium sp. NPDC000396]|uniref:hypothetical protein n=1 Tax=Streptosporangium sp. NPDC000396 TaxID=3366185 RepID=UPI0036BF7DF7